MLSGREAKEAVEVTARQDARAFRTWMVAQLDADEAGSDWPHRPSCQMMTSVPEGFPFKGFSCNCDAPNRWLAEVEAKRRRLKPGRPPAGFQNVVPGP